MRSRYAAFRTYAIGWLGYFALDQVKTTFTNLDKWLRRRVRACYWKQWRKSTTRLKKRISLDVAARAARGSAMSGKGAWRLSKTSSVQSALSIEYLTNEGLLNLEERWRSLASMRRTPSADPHAEVCVAGGRSNAALCRSRGYPITLCMIRAVHSLPEKSPSNVEVQIVARHHRKHCHDHICIAKNSPEAASNSRSLPRCASRKNCSVS